MVNGKGTLFSAASEAVSSSYDQNVTDEFIEPACISENNAPIGRVKNGDVALCFNFRTDRPREITTALTQRDFPELEMKALTLDYYSMTNYDSSFDNVNVVFKKDNLIKTLGEVLQDNNKNASSNS